MKKKKIRYCIVNGDYEPNMTGHATLEAAIKDAKAKNAKYIYSGPYRVFKLDPNTVPPIWEPGKD